MSLLTVFAHGASGWLDEFVQFGLPLLVLVGLYLWSSRKSDDRGGRR